MESFLRVIDPPPTDPASGIEVTLAGSSSAQDRPRGGLITVEYEVRAHTGHPLVLRITPQDAPEAAVERPLSLQDGVARGWFALHGHLLPDGPAIVDLEVWAGSRRVAACSVGLMVANPGELAAAVRQSLRRSGAPLVLEDLCDASAYDYGDLALKPWFEGDAAAVEAHLSGLLSAGEASAAEVEALRRFHQDGYLVMADLIDAGHLERLNSALIGAVERGVEGYEWGSSQRLHNLHLDYAAVGDLWRHPQILRMLGLIFGAPAIPYQSLTYVFGSQQKPHQDTVALTPFPAGRMCGVWTALEDIQASSGELVVYPGSHRLPRIYMSDAGAAKVEGDWSEFRDTVARRWREMIASQGREPVIYRPKAGAVLIWHENLMHGGSAREVMERSRKSFVGHYFARGAIAYHDATGMPGHLDDRTPQAG